jgi:CHAT domain-containing protein/tetratricopeptide (TPR) repeat protein
VANLADVLTDSGLYNEGVREHQRATALQERGNPGATPELIDHLARLGRAFTLAERYREALDVLTKSVATAERFEGSNPRAIALTLERLTAVQLQLGLTREARGTIERAQHIRERLPPEHPDHIGTLNLLGDVAWFEGQFPEAQRYYSGACERAERTLHPEHPVIAISLRNLASATARLGDLPRARALRERSLKLAEASLGATHPEVAGCLNDLANSALTDGDYVEARRLFDRALRITEQYFGPSHLRAATFLNNLAILHQRLGDLDLAARLQSRALGIWAQQYSNDHAYVARALSTLGSIRRDQRRLSESASLYDRALALQKRQLGATHREVARTMAELGAVQGDMARAQGARAAPYRFERASELLRTAIEVWEQQRTPDDPGLARARAALGRVQLDQREWRPSQATLERALEAHERVLGASHPETAVVRSHLADSLAAVGEGPRALTAALRAEHEGRDHLRLTMRDLPERVALTFAASRPTGLDVALTLASSGSLSPFDLERVLNELVKSRAAVLDEVASRYRVQHDEGSGIGRLRAALAAGRQRLANIVVRGPESMPLDRYRGLVDRARQQKEDAERALAAASASFNQEIKRSDVDLSGVLTQLAPGTCLVSFVRFNRRTLDRLRIVPSYAAFVARGGEPNVLFVPLGEARSLEAAVSTWRTEVTAGLTRPGVTDAASAGAYRKAAVALRQRIWDPIEPAIGQAERVLVVPDGALNVVSFAALPIGRTAYLVERTPIVHYLSAERDVVLAGQDHQSGRGLLAIGSPAFDLTPVERSAAAVPRSSQAPSPRNGNDAKPMVVAKAVSASNRMRSTCGTFESMLFQPLPASSREVQMVARAWSQSSEKAGESATAEGAQVLTGRNAGERVFKQMAPGHRILHLATHGFFLGGACVSDRQEGTRGVGGLARRVSPAPKVENPLLLSGLALAGANIRSGVRRDRDDGILTAEEIAGLDLSGVEWAVLSACDTGIGEIKNGEGVFGLRRALQVAGARTLVMSLWAVEDEAGLAWMRALYDERFTRKLDTANAVRNASLTVLAERRKRGLSTHPFYWAGFVAAGDWR